MTLIVKDGQARLLMPGPQRELGGFNGFRQPSNYVGIWSYDLGEYTGGGIGLFTYWHRATFRNITITDLSDDSSLPSAYCDADPQATCTSGGVCTAVPVSDVCEDPVGGIDVDVTSLEEWDFIADELVTGNCQWETPDLGAGPKLYQSSNANGGKESLGCNALHKSGTYTDFLLQFDMDIYDNDALGMTFGWKALDDHYKIHKVVSYWPAPKADNVEGSAFKIKKRLPGTSCALESQNATCHETIAFIDNQGVSHQAMPAGAVAPWQYSGRMYDYETGLGKTSRMVLMVKGNELRTYFTTDGAPALKIPAFAFDLSPYGYSGGRVGLHVMSQQAQYYSIKLASLSGSNAVTEFCSESGTCNTLTGLCE